MATDYRTIRQEVIDFAQGELESDELADAISRVYDYCLDHRFENIDQIDPDVFVDLMEGEVVEPDHNAELSEALGLLNLRTVSSSDRRFLIVSGPSIRQHCIQDVMRDWADLTDLIGRYHDEPWRKTVTWKYVYVLHRVMGNYIKEENLNEIPI